MTEAASVRWLLDANALVALSLSTHVHHRPAHAALSTCGAFATSALTESALVRLLLNEAVTGKRFSPPQVLGVLAGLRADPRWTFLGGDATLADPLIDATVLVGHRQVTDLCLVNLAAHHSALLATFDARIVAGLAPADRVHVHLIPH